MLNFSEVENVSICFSTTHIELSKISQSQYGIVALQDPIVGGKFTKAKRSMMTIRVEEKEKKGVFVWWIQIQFCMMNCVKMNGSVSCTKMQMYLMPWNCMHSCSP